MLYIINYITMNVLLLMDISYVITYLYFIILMDNFNTLNKTTKIYKFHIFIYYTF